MSLASSRASASAALSCGLAVLVLSGCRHPASLSAPPTPVASANLDVPRFPGVDLIRTNSGGVLIRVISGLVGADPLYVVDGTPVQVDRRRGLDWLRPEDIARVEVLKNPADTAIYGPRGADGVIVITTRRR